MGFSGLGFRVWEVIGFGFFFKGLFLFRIWSREPRLRQALGFRVSGFFLRSIKRLFEGFVGFVGLSRVSV